MPRTVVIRQTWHCTGCRFEADRLVGACSTEGCTGTIFEETDPARCGSFTIIGPEEIDAEISGIVAARLAKGSAPLSQATLDAHKAQRLAEISAAITAAQLRAHAPVDMGGTPA